MFTWELRGVGRGVVLFRREKSKSCVGQAKICTGFVPCISLRGVTCGEFRLESFRIMLYVNVDPLCVISNFEKRYVVMRYLDFLRYRYFLKSLYPNGFNVQKRFSNVSAYIG